MKKHTKIKLAVVISIISIIITIISLCFSIYVGTKDMEYKDYIKSIQGSSSEMQKENVQFQESYDKISLAEKTLSDTLSNCQEINKPQLNVNLNLLANARTALINNDYNAVSNNLNNINSENICKTELPNTLFIEITILAIIWLALIITLIKVLRK